ncbi:MAG: hypothetical protein V4710_06035 [Verrucomicrobiota bacterium]
MADPAGTKNDNGVKFNRQTVSIKNTLGEVTTYILRKGSLKSGANRVVGKDENDVETKQSFAKTIPSGSVQINFVTEDDKSPAQFEEFTVKDLSGATVALIISEVGEEFGSGDEASVSLECYKKMGT